jgi:excisionase family DNA binding protein
MLATTMYGAPASMPNESDRDAARDASRALAKIAGNKSVHVEALGDQNERQNFVLPAAAVRLLTDMLSHLAEGRAVAVIPEDAELTTQQAADMLNVSRPHLVSLLEKDRLAYRLVGTHRRIRYRDVASYQRESAKKQRDALDALASEAQELDMGY